MPGESGLAVWGLAGIGEVGPSDDLATVLLGAARESGESLQDGDIVVVSSKVVSKAEGRAEAAGSRENAISAETVRVVASRLGPDGVTRIVESAAGPVLAAAGVDASNTPRGTVLMLPKDPDGSARALRQGLAAGAGVCIGVVISDTAGRPWRQGQTDFALGCAGVRVVDDLRGSRDSHGNPLRATVRALADEIAAMADLVKGKHEGVPAAVVRGLGWAVTPDDGPGAAELVRTGDGDWFAHGHVDAVRLSLGAGDVAPAPMVLEPLPEGLRARLDRAVSVALTAEPEPANWRLRVEGRQVRLTTASPPDEASLVRLGALTQRLVSALFAEGLPGSWRYVDGEACVQVATSAPGALGGQRPAEPVLDQAARDGDGGG